LWNWGRERGPRNFKLHLESEVRWARREGRKKVATKRESLQHCGKKRLKKSSFLQAKLRAVGIIEGRAVDGVKRPVLRGSITRGGKGTDGR